MHAETITEKHSHAAHGHGPTKCLNCGHEFEGNFCNQCGQSAHTHAINWHYIWHEIPHSVGHIDRGILFTLRQLCTRPGHTIREFLEGKRVNHYRPLALLILLGAVLVFVMNGLDLSMAKLNNAAYASSNADAEAKAFMAQYNEFVEKKMTLLNMLFLPFFAFGSWLAFRRKGYNYPQLLVAQTFTANFGMLLSLLIFLIVWALGGSSSTFGKLSFASMFISLIYKIIVDVQLFQGKLRKRSIVMRSISGYVLGYVALLVPVMIGALGFGIYMGMNNPKKINANKKPAATVQQVAPIPH
jgi:hypothetical protein